MSKIIKVLKNKYFVATVFFLAIFLFLAENNLRVTLRLKKQVNELQEQVVALREGIVADSINAVALTNDPTAIERYGREHYYMKRADEDIYIIK